MATASLHPLKSTARLRLASRCTAWLMLLTAASPLLTASAPPSPSQPAPKQNGGNTELPYLLTVGSTDISVVLNSNPSTGYTWQILSQSNTRCATVELINRLPKQSNGTPIIGAPAQTIVKVTAWRPGTSQVVLAYGRPWEHPLEITRRITLSITIIPAT